MTIADHPLVIFDGFCNFCSHSVRIILKNDRSNLIRFTPSQSPLGQRLLREFALDPISPDSFVVVNNGHAYLKSDAAIEIASSLAFPWRLAVALRIIPRFIRDAAYGVIARNRYQWFGKRDACFIPTNEERDRFIENA
jgi:predicted DCC family thiol-disulfide oxidoreductase YuxK